MAAITRRQYKGAAASTTLLSSINDTDVAPTCSLTAVTGWPSSVGVPFFVVIDPGTTREEKCLATISGTTLTLDRSDSTRDDTVKASHAVGAVIYPVFTATEANETNLLASTMTTRGDLLTMDSTTTVSRLAVGATSGHVLTSNGTDPVWGQVSNVGVAAGAAIAYSKLNLATSIVNADVSTTAAIALSKLATTGTLTATTFVGALTGTASNASKIDNHTVFVQSATPTALATGDIWFQTA